LPPKDKIHDFIVPIGLAGIPVGAYNAATGYPLIGILVAVVGVAAAELAIYELTRPKSLTRLLRLRQRSGMTPEPTVQDETANNGDDSPADGIQGDHADQQECEHHQGAPPSRSP
jgi:hypothetical protein